MEFIKPKAMLGTKVNWSISDQTKSIVKYYAEYSGYSENEVVDQFLKNILKDDDFVQWIHSKRRNKRAISQIYGEEQLEESQIG